MTPALIYIWFVFAAALRAMAAQPAPARTRKQKVNKTQKGPVGNEPCIVGDLFELKTGKATVTASGLMMKDLHDVNGKMLPPLEYVEYLKGQDKQAKRKQAVAEARAKGCRRRPLLAAS